MKKINRKFTRRNFIFQTAGSTAGLLLTPALKNVFGKEANPASKSTVVVVHDEKAFNGASIDQNVVQLMMDAGIMRLAGIGDVGEAWKSLFPGITKSSVIGIKINCLFSSMASKPAVIKTITNGLVRMVVEGSAFPENNIIVWDNDNGRLQAAGFTINTGKTGARCFGTNGDYDSTVYPVNGGSSQRISKILTEKIHFLINASVLKNHGMSGVSLSLKNHYGTCHNPGGLHDNWCNPAIPSLNALQAVRQKQAIAVCDALYGVISGGPDNYPQVTPKSLIFSKDPVALDYTGAQMLQTYGCKTTSLSYEAKHIATAAKAPYNLGTCDPANIDTINIENPTTGIEAEPEVDGLPENSGLLHNYPNPFNAQTIIHYQIDKPCQVRLGIVNALGKTVVRLVQKHETLGNHRVIWDGKDGQGHVVPSGTYIAVLETGEFRRTVKMQLLR